MGAGRGHSPGGPRCAVPELLILAVWAIALPAGCDDEPMPPGPCTGVMCGTECVHLGDRRNCSGCFDACGWGESCSFGQCVCARPCNGECLRPQQLEYDSENCGECGNRCPEDQPYCGDSTCGQSCGPHWSHYYDYDRCGSQCVDADFDHENCGCSEECAAAAVCVWGLCRGGDSADCPEPCSGAAGLACCPGVDGPHCANLLEDPANCGSCGARCVGPCEMGECPEY